MGLFRWFTRNWANTTEPTHPDLRPLELPLLIEEAAAIVGAAVGSMGRWRVMAENRAAGNLHLTRRTTLFGFTDDVRLTFEPGPGGCRVHAESRSRVGTGDFGQNRRNILELWRAVNTLSRDAQRSAR